MKNKFLMAVLVGSLFSAMAYAQKGELNNAQKSYDSYSVVAGQKSSVMATQAKSNLNDAKTSIDKAAANPKTADMPQTYALKGAIYAAITVQDTVAATAAVSYSTAAEALKKAKDMDTKGEFKKLIDDGNLNLYTYSINKGVGEYQQKKYADAYKSFDAARTIMPEDTTILLNEALAAYNSQNYTGAITNYTKLTTVKYSKMYQVYEDLPNIYLANKDTTGALKVLSEGVAKFPNDNNLRNREIEINLVTGHQNDMVNKIDAAIKNDPKNKTLYYYAGITYSQIAENAGADYKKAAKTAAKTGPQAAKDAANLSALNQKKEDNFNKAADMYKKALEIDPNYAEAVLNLGYVIISPGLDLYNEARQLPMTKQKEYDADMAKFNTQLDAAKPYLQKAVDLNPKSIDALSNLKAYYLGKNDMANANAIQKKIDALPAGK